MMPQKPKLLLVDDDPGILDSYPLLLESTFEVITAQTIEDALAAFHKEQGEIPVAIIDLVMQEGEEAGLDLTEQIVASGSGTKVIIFTAYGSLTTADRGIRLGIAGYIEKGRGDTIDILIDRVNWALELYIEERRKDAIERPIDRAKRALEPYYEESARKPYVQLDANDKVRTIQGINVKFEEEKPESGVKRFMAEKRELFQVTEADVDSLKLYSSQPHPYGKQLRFHQTVNGIRVYGSDVIFRLGKDDALKGVSADFLSDVSVDSTEPKIDAEKAATAAKEDAKNLPEFTNEGDITHEEPELLIYPHQGAYRLAYKIVVQQFPLASYTYFVDANDGTVIDKKTNLRTAKITGQVYLTIPKVGLTSKGFPYEYVETEDDKYVTDVRGFYAPNPSVQKITTRLAGKFVDVLDYSKHQNGQLQLTHTGAVSFEWNQKWHNDTSSPHFNEAMVYYHLNRAHDFFEKFSDSIIGDSDTLPNLNEVQAFVNVTDSERRENAYWTGSAFLFGDGALFCHEAAIIYHEYAHAVIDKVVQRQDILPYEKMPGAMNEAYADYFGCSLTDDSEIGQTVGLGRQLDNNAQFPNDFRPCISPPSGVNDHGYVHTNCTIYGGALWDIRKTFIESYGEHDGVKNSDKVIFDSLFELPHRATFKDGLGTLIIADQNNFDGINRERIEEAFRKHGITEEEVAEPLPSRDDFPAMMTIEQAAMYLQQTPQEIRRAVDEGCIPSYERRPDGEICILKDDLNKEFEN